MLVADYEVKPTEGTAQGVYVIFKFETEKKALAIYNNPAYNPSVRAIRFTNTAERTAVLVKEFNISIMK